MACGMQLYFCVSCLATNVVVSRLYMFHTAVMSYLAAFSEPDEEFNGFALEVPGMLTVMTEIL